MTGGVARGAAQGIAAVEGKAPRALAGIDPNALPR